MVTRVHNRSRKKRPDFTPPETSVIEGPLDTSISDAVQGFIEYLLENSRLDSVGDKRQAPKMNMEAAIRVLETTPHPRHKLDDETKKRVQEILDKIDSEEIADKGIADASENLDKYLYDPHYDEAS